MGSWFCLDRLVLFLLFRLLWLLTLLNLIIRLFCLIDPCRWIGSIVFVEWFVRRLESIFIFLNLLNNWVFFSFKRNLLLLRLNFADRTLVFRGFTFVLESLCFFLLMVRWLWFFLLFGRFFYPWFLIVFYLVLLFRIIVFVQDLMRYFDILWFIQVNLWVFGFIFRILIIYLEIGRVEHIRCPQCLF